MYYKYHTEWKYVHTNCYLLSTCLFYLGRSHYPNYRL